MKKFLTVLVISIMLSKVSFAVELSEQHTTAIQDKIKSNQSEMQRAAQAIQQRMQEIESLKHSISRLRGQNDGFEWIKEWKVAATPSKKTILKATNGEYKVYKDMHIKK